MSQISTDITKEDDTGWKLRVTVQEDDESFQHHLSVPKEYKEEIVSDEIPVSVLVEASFEYLLDKESKESILPSFDLQDIEDYFPKYPTEIQKYL